MTLLTHIALAVLAWCLLGAVVGLMIGPLLHDRRK